MICPKSDYTFYGGNKYLVYKYIVKQIGPIEPINIWDEGRNLVINAPNEQCIEKVKELTKIAMVQLKKEQTQPH